MKRFILIAAIAALTAPVADACDRARSRAVSRTVTATVVQAPSVVMVPVTRTVEKTILVPTKVQTTETVLVPKVVAAPPVVTTRTTERVRGREMVRGVVGAPLRIVGGVLQAVPCAGCK